LPDAGTVLALDGCGNANWTAAPNDGSLVVDLTTHEPYEESARSEEMPKVMCDDLVEA